MSLLSLWGVHVATHPPSISSLSGSRILKDRPSDIASTNDIWAKQWSSSFRYLKLAMPRGEEHYLLQLFVICKPSLLLLPCPQDI